MKLICGDAYEEIKKIPDKSIDLVYVDIPYLMHLGGGSFVKTRNVYKEIKTIVNGIDYSIFDDFCRILKKINIFIWCSKDQIYDILDYFVKKDTYYTILVWCKTNPIPLANSVFLPDLEYCIYVRGKDYSIINGDYTNKSRFYLSGINMKDKGQYDHPTIKPLKFVKDHILCTTFEGDVVLDCFMGSGTTGVACKELNRDFIGIEVDEKYFNIAKDRINGITQREREQINDGQKSIFDYEDNI